MAVLGFVFLLLLLWPGIVKAHKSVTIGHKPTLSYSSSKATSVISSDSVLVALLDSPYTELAEMADEASLLPFLEEMVGTRAITILAPRNSFLDRDLDPDFRRFLLQPGNIASLRNLLRFHVAPQLIRASAWPSSSQQTLLQEEVKFSARTVNGLYKQLKVDLSNVVAPDAIVRRDGVVHGIDRLLIPKSVQNEFNRWKEERTDARILAVFPMESPTPKTYAEEKAAKAKATIKHSAPGPPRESIFQALAPGPALAPAPAPGPSSGHRYFDGLSVVNDFISSLVRYGGYNEMADLLVNLTSLAPEIAKLVTEGYRMTILAPNDDAMARLTVEDLTAPGAPELIIFYHIIPEYQTEESFYNAVRRFGKVLYQTLRDPYKLATQEEDGTVVFGEGKGNQAHLIDIDIFKDGRISVQGIDRVLSPTKEEQITSKKGRKLDEESQDINRVDQQHHIASILRIRDRKNRGWFSTTLCGVFGRIVTSCSR